MSTATGSLVHAKEIGPPCNCHKRCYEKVGEENICTLFEGYWGSGSSNIQTTYIQERTQVTPVKRIRTADPIFCSC